MCVSLVFATTFFRSSVLNVMFAWKFNSFKPKKINFPFIFLHFYQQKCIVAVGCLVDGVCPSSYAILRYYLDWYFFFLLYCCCLIYSTNNNFHIAFEWNFIFVYRARKQKRLIKKKNTRLASYCSPLQATTLTSHFVLLYAYGNVAKCARRTKHYKNTYTQRI